MASARVAEGDCDVAEWELEMLRNAITLISPDLLLLPTPTDISTLDDYVWAIPYKFFRFMKRR